MFGLRPSVKTTFEADRRTKQPLLVQRSVEIMLYLDSLKKFVERGMTSTSFVDTRMVFHALQKQNPVMAS